MFNWPHLTHGLAFEWRRLRRDGVASLAGKAVVRALSLGLGLSLLPLTAGLHLAGFRRVLVFTDRIGHLALELDCLLKDQAMGHIIPRRWFLLAPPQRVANNHLLGYWRAFVTVHRGGIACFTLESMTRWGLMRHDVSHYVLSVRKAQAAYRVQSEWGTRPPLLALSSADREWGAAQLHELGLPEGVWFACVHVREAGFSPLDDELHAHRNADIDTTIAAMDEIVRRGGWVVRIGDPTMKRLAPMPRVIDYAHSPAKCDRLDVVLCATARFILGNTSGIALVGTVFGVPCALANVIPTPTLWFGPNDLSIPKLLWSKALGRHLRLEEILKSDIAGYRYAELYDEAGIRVDDNTAEDIRSLAAEMLDRLDGRHRESAADRARALVVTSLLRPHHYAFGSCAAFASSFLRTHAAALGLPCESGPPVAVDSSRSALNDAIRLEAMPGQPRQDSLR